MNRTAWVGLTTMLLSLATVGAWSAWSKTRTWSLIDVPFSLSNGTHYHAAELISNLDALYGISNEAHTDRLDRDNHINEYVNGRVHTQGIENFSSLLKRGPNGTYVAVEPFHMDAYVDEQVFRYNTRKDTEAKRFQKVLSQVAGKRLTYTEVTGKVGETKVN